MPQSESILVLWEKNMYMYVESLAYLLLRIRITDITYYGYKEVNALVRSTWSLPIFTVLAFLWLSVAFV